MTVELAVAPALGETRWTVACPKCGAVSPWSPQPSPVPVRCVHPAPVSRQQRRAAERDGYVATGVPCDAQFTVLPVPGSLAR